MDSWAEIAQIVIRDRIRAREVEAADERLAAAAHGVGPTGLRSAIGRLFIRAPRQVTGKPATGKPVAPIIAAGRVPADRARPMRPRIIAR